MEDVPQTTRSESLAALRSAIVKTEKALAGMASNGASTVLVARRLQALRVGLAVLEDAWRGWPSPYSSEDLAEARGVLSGLLPSVEAICARSKPGTPQRTLLERRIRALNLALQAIEG